MKRSSINIHAQLLEFLPQHQTAREKSHDHPIFHNSFYIRYYLLASRETCVNDSLKRSSTDAGVESIPPAVSLNSMAATIAASSSKHNKWARRLRGTHALIVSPMVSG
ncbi:hypothetical protein Pdw03_7789 [Penicillium digitatum]|uniref:Uncharacterized protein n=1 Tax=Penicillium digitatum TaxID=36651 RepID=A0A7T6XMT9_PENDI|nr:hypothetical protein Pdw03_7789 [Penicillium digitatum]